MFRTKRDDAFVVSQRTVACRGRPVQKALAACSPLVRALTRIMQSLGAGSHPHPYVLRRCNVLTLRPLSIGVAGGTAYEFYIRNDAKEEPALRQERQVCICAT